MRVNLLYYTMEFSRKNKAEIEVAITAHISVKNIGFEKKVSIVSPGDEPDTVIWKVISEAEYICPIDYNNEYWVARFNLNLNYPTFGRPFALRFIYDYYTYWDNNKGHNYWIRKEFPNAYISEGEVYLLDLKYKQGKLSGLIAVKNIDFQKEVILIYTSDEWESQHEITATYRMDQEKYETERELSIDFFQFETNIDKNILPENIKCFVRYLVAGKEYFDTHFANNYQLKDFK